MKLKNIVSIGSLLVMLASLVACNNQQTETANQIRVGTMAGPDARVLNKAKEVAADKYHLNIKIVEFTDYALPNIALNDGSIDANIFQHQPYLDETIQAKQYPLATIGKTFIFPMGLYSQTVKNLKEIKQGAKVAIPNDPSNEARALILLEKAGLITLKKGVNTKATTKDILSNPKELQISTLDAAQLPRVLPDVAIAVINSNYAIPAGLVPTRDAIFLENNSSPYVNIIVVRKADIDNDKLKKLVEVMHSSEVKAAANKIFEGQAIPGWK